MQNLVKHSFIFWLVIAVRLFGQTIENTEGIPPETKRTEALSCLLPSTDQFTYVECKIAPIDPSSEHYLQRQRRFASKMINIPNPNPGILGILGIRGQGLSFESAYSSNWAGYAAATDFKTPVRGSVDAVSGIWPVPTLSPSKRNTYCAIWIGIDGYNNGTVEQIGTSHDWKNGAQENYAWFEMYPKSAYEILDFPIKENDLIGTVCQHMGNGVFQMSIFNYTTNNYTTLPTSWTTRHNAQRTSAEWIVEAPFYRKTLPLANFNFISMTNCQAVINGVLGPINSPKWKSVSIEMIESDFPKATVSDLTPSGDGFSTFWKQE